MYRSIFVFLISVFLWTGASAVTLSFDDIPGGSIQNAYDDIGTYEGFTFSTNLDWIDLESNTWPYGAFSGDFALLNNNGGNGTVTEASGGTFTFGGMWAKQWATSPESGGTNYLTGTFEGYLEGERVWSVSTQLNGSYQFFSAQSGNIDTLHFNMGNYYQVDDLTFNEIAQVPEPSNYALLGMGVAVLGLFWIRRRR